MKPATFEYHAPTTVAETLSVLAEHGDDARALAGGQSLVPLMAMRMSRAEHVVDLNGVDGLAGVSIGGDHVTIGAMTRQAHVGRDPLVATHVPLLARATPLIGHFQIRNRGTLGGSLAHADPAAEYPAVALALDAEMEIASESGTRVVPADAFFEGMWSTCLRPGELLTAVRFPVYRPGHGSAVEEVARRHGDFAMVGTAVRVCVVDDVIRECAIALFGVGSVPVRVPAAEARACGPRHGLDVDAVAGLAVDDLATQDDIHASAAYRRRVGAVVVRRALSAAMEEAVA